MRVYVARAQDGSVIGVFCRRETAEGHSEMDVQEWVVDAPELGPTSWVRDPKTGLSVPSS